jgi:regulator of sirC expression with transglutaminase-like and TPR domain
MILVSTQKKNSKAGCISWDAVKALLDDESEVVRNALVEQLKAFPIEGQSFLLGMSQGQDTYLAKHAQNLIERLGWIDGTGDFLRFIQSLRYELETGWFLLDRTVCPDFEMSTYSFFLDKLADRCRELLLQPSNPRVTCEVLNRVLFHEFGFRGARENFENPENSFLHRVLDRREGLPISLCAIYILVARRIGFELDPIGTPGRFMVGCFTERHPFYIDCWAGGKLIELEQMEDKLGMIPDEESGAILLPVTVAETLTRACRNLSHHYRSLDDLSKVRMFESFIDEFERVHKEAPNA